MMIPAGHTRRPSIGLALGASTEVIGAELIETAQADAEFECGGLG